MGGVRCGVKRIKNADLAYRYRTVKHSSNRDCVTGRQSTAEGHNNLNIIEF
jgi:hypothetical protein